jgi:aspartate racemase
VHIGLIGGIGPAATVVYYPHIVSGLARVGQPLHLTIAHTSAATLSHNVSTGQAEPQAAEFARLTEQLAAAGADVVAITSMGGHFCADEFAARSCLPILNGPRSVAEHLRAQGIHRVGVLGTRIVMQTHLYGALAQLDPVTPIGDELAEVNDDYIAIAIAGAATISQRERLVAAGERLVRDQGAEAVLLGGTDLNLVFDGKAFDFRVVDSALVHADAIISAALCE